MLNKIKSLTAQPFIRFAIIGTLIMFVDALCLLILTIWLDAYSARLISYAVAVTGSWWLNRHFTFKAQKTDKLAAEWLSFVLVNTVGFALNYGAYTGLVYTFNLTGLELVLAVAAGSLSGLAWNFFGSRHFIYRIKNKPAPLQE